jgi:3-phenylpropionate/trans-cinnamate dioxygenase ferredoxin subunit
MGKFVKIAKTYALNSEELNVFQIDDQSIILCRIDDEFFAFDEICSHQHASLVEGWLDNHTIECPLHGAQFDIRTGEALTLPAVENIKTYEVKKEGEDIFVRLD